MANKDFMDLMSNYEKALYETLDALKKDQSLFETGSALRSKDMLINFIHRYGHVAIHAINIAIRDGKINTVCAGELLRQLSEIEVSGIRDKMTGMLTDYLSNPSPRIRDGAIMGLSNIGSLEAMRALELHLDNESDPFLYVVIRQIIKSIKDKHNSQQKEECMTLNRKPEDIINQSIVRNSHGESIPLKKANLTEDEMMTPLKFLPGSLTNAEFVVLQAAGEQIARAIMNQMGTPDAIQVRSQIQIQKDEYERTSGFVLTLTGTMILPPYSEDNQPGNNNDEDINNTNLSEGEIY